MAESKDAMVGQYRRDAHPATPPAVPAPPRDAHRVPGRRDPPRPEEDVEWIVDLLPNGLSSRSRA